MIIIVRNALRPEDKLIGGQTRTYVSPHWYYFVTDYYIIRV